MDRAAPSLDTLQALELRVLEGPLRGASAPLPSSAPCVLAAGATAGDDAGAHDIVLRDAAAEPVRVRIRAELSQAVLEVLDGRVRIGNRTLASGERALWQAYVPLAIGDSIVAFGLACLDEWKTGTRSHRADGRTADGSPADGSAADGSGADDTAADGTAGGAATTADAGRPAVAARPPRQRRAGIWLALVGAATLAFCGVALGLAGSIAPAPVPTPLPSPTPADPLAQRLDAIDGEVLVRAVTETFRVNGVTVRAQVAGPGSVAVDASERDAARLARAEQAVRRDVHGLDTLVVRNAAPPVPPPPAPRVPDDPGKRIASLVPGETAYLVTADGSRYFVGALLPTGHRITRIGAASVTVERDGQRSTLSF
ncbi:MAG: hypothetical protein AB7G13_02545 [Lautropia sp.]